MDPYKGKKNRQGDTNTHLGDDVELDEAGFGLGNNNNDHASQQQQAMYRQAGGVSDEDILEGAPFIPTSDHSHNRKYRITPVESFIPHAEFLSQEDRRELSPAAQKEKARMLYIAKQYPKIDWISEGLAKLNGIANALQTAPAVFALVWLAGASVGGPLYFFMAIVFCATTYMNYAIPRRSISEVGARIHASITNRVPEDALGYGLRFWGKFALGVGFVFSVITSVLYGAFSFKGALKLAETATASSVGIGLVLGSGLAAYCFYKALLAFGNIFYVYYKNRRGGMLDDGIPEFNRKFVAKSVCKVFLFLKLGIPLIVLATNGMLDGAVMTVGVTTVASLGGAFFGVIAGLCFTALMMNAIRGLLTTDGSYREFCKFIKNIVYPSYYVAAYCANGDEGYVATSGDYLRWIATLITVPVVIIASCIIGLGSTIYTCKLALESTFAWIPGIWAWFASGIAFFTNVPFVVQSTVNAPVALFRKSYEAVQTWGEWLLVKTVSLFTVVLPITINATGNALIAANREFSDLLNGIAITGAGFMSFSAAFFNELSPVRDVVKSIKEWCRCCLGTPVTDEFSYEKRSLLSVSAEHVPVNNRNGFSGGSSDGFASEFPVAIPSRQPSIPMAILSDDASKSQRGFTVNSGNGRASIVFAPAPQGSPAGTLLNGRGAYHPSGFSHPIFDTGSSRRPRSDSNLSSVADPYVSTDPGQSSTVPNL